VQALRGIVAFAIVRHGAAVFCCLFAWFGVATLRAQAPFTHFTRLHSFGIEERMGTWPLAPLIEGSDGALYGTTSDDRNSGPGNVFKVNKDGSGYIVLHRFQATTNDGSFPRAAVLEGSDGALYGTTSKGGSGVGNWPGGTVFKINKDGSGYVVLHSFSLTDSNGFFPSTPLVEGSDGALYGTTELGDFRTARGGTIFKLQKDGSGYEVLHKFSTPTSGGSVEGSAVGSLVVGGDGALYGTTEGGGTNRVGTLFKINTDGTGFEVVRHFRYAGPGQLDGAYPDQTLAEGSDGALYGTTQYGGLWEYGTVFKVNKDGSDFAVLYSFAPEERGGYGAAIMEGRDGALYGTTESGGDLQCCGSVFKLNKDGSDYTVLHSFGYYPTNGFGIPSGGIPGDGVKPLAALLETREGVLYGTTYDGGVVAPHSIGFGTIFKLNKDGTDYGIVHRFDLIGGDGGSPNAVTEGRDGVLYGTAVRGGSRSGYPGAGIIFKVNKDGSDYSVLRSFQFDDEAGSNPESTVVEGSDGALYGTTPGRVFRINRDGSDFSVLHTFAGGTNDGTWPAAELVEAGNGALYGTTTSGGNSNLGTIFRLNKDGSGYAVLRSFSGLDGAVPRAALLVVGGDTLYGTTVSGGVSSNGVVFRMDLDGGSYVVLHSFAEGGQDGAYPRAGLLRGSDGVLYGTTSSGGGTNRGTVFRLHPDGTGYAVLHSFPGNSVQGWNPSVSLVEGPDGWLYGTTSNGGDANYGTIFRLNKDGSGFAVLRSFAGRDGSGPDSVLIKGSDGALYGTAAGGGDSGYGTVFSLSIAQTVCCLAVTQEGVSFTLSGLPGRNYTIERASSPDGPWSELNTLLMPVSGLRDFLDSRPLPGQAFYRTVSP